MLSQTGGRGMEHSLKLKGGKKEKENVIFDGKVDAPRSATYFIFLIEDIHNRLLFIVSELCYFLEMTDMKKLQLCLKSSK